jgi:hypothetical protein
VRPPPAPQRGRVATHSPRFSKSTIFTCYFENVGKGYEVDVVVIRPPLTPPVGEKDFKMLNGDMKLMW